MRRSAVAAAGVWLSVLLPIAATAQDLPPPVVREVHITGAHEISSEAIQNALRITIGEPLADAPERIADLVTRQYREEGYTFARVKSSLDAASGALTLDIDEGAIDG